MKKVITYGTFDFFHEGHYRLLKRAKELGDYLIVGVTTEEYDKSRGKLNVQEDLMQRIENVKASRLADEIIIEEYEGQKIHDIQKYNVDIFAIGSDWRGKFEYLNEFCEVVYLERTKGISSTELRAEKNGIIKLGIVGFERMSSSFIKESKYVSGLHVEGIYGDKSKQTEMIGFIEKYELDFFETDFNSFLKRVDAVYIASDYLTHYDYLKEALNKGKHILYGAPMILCTEKAKELNTLAEKNNCILLEAIKTAYIPGFIRLVNIAKCGLIGEIKNIDVTYTKTADSDVREKRVSSSVAELIAYPLLAIIKLLGTEFEKFNFYSYDRKDQLIKFTKLNLKFKEAIATVKVGLGVKYENSLIISGTKGYIYVPASWWETEYFEIRYGNADNNKKYCYKLEGDGERYELAEFVKMINKKRYQTYKLLPSESLVISEIMKHFINGENVETI